MKGVDPRLLRHARAARTYLIVTVMLGLVATGLVLTQAALVAHALAAAALGSGATALTGTLVLLLGVVVARAAATYGGEAAALRAAARVKSQLRRKLTEHCLRLGPAWLSGQQPGQIAALTTRGLDGLDPYFARYLPQLVLSVLVPAAVVVAVTATDWISGVVIAVTLPLIPLFAAVVGLHTKAQTRRQWRLLAQLAGHFLDVVQGLPTLKAFGRAKFQEQVIDTVTDEYRSAAMATLRVAFLSALVLELSAALATAVVAVETGLRLLYGHMPYQAALLVLLLTPEAYLPLRALAAQYHASAEGTAAAESIFAILEVQTTQAGAARAARMTPVPDLRSATIRLSAVTVAYPARDLPPSVRSA
jgi:ABC-type transport system involved in cytochrome bd biosynthesis fused ATPase/permease subunit